MSEAPPLFPVADRVGFARLMAEEEGPTEVVLDVPGVDGISLFASQDGALTVTIECPSTSVVEDGSRPAFRIARVAAGATIQIGARVPTEIAAAALTAVVSRIADGQPRGRVPAEVVREFAGMLAGAVGPRLSEQRLVGLLGELEVLREVLVAGGPWTAWKGYLKDHADFRVPWGPTLEVKSTLSANHRHVHINGLRQLEDPDDGSDLYLVLRRYERAAEPEGTTVPDLVDELVGRGVPVHELMEALTETGYQDVHADAYREHRYVGTQRALRLIDDNHPRLTERILDEAGVDRRAVRDVDYLLDLEDSVAEDLDVALADLLQRTKGGA